MNPLLKVIENICTGFKMKFRTNKYKINSIGKSKHHDTGPYILYTQQNSIIDEMKINDTYKYFGLDHSKIKKKLIKKYTDRLN